MKIWNKKQSGGGFIGFSIEENGKRIGTASSLEDARLISSAPDLLLACKTAYNLASGTMSPNQYLQHQEILFKAIVKAEGREE